MITGMNPEKTNNWVFWVSIFIGFLTVIVAYWMTQPTNYSMNSSMNTGMDMDMDMDMGMGIDMVEKFADATEPTPLPRPNNVDLYINGFLDTSGNVPSYDYIRSNWKDTLNPNTIKFALSATSTENIPASLNQGTGLPMKTVTLKGPSSQTLRDDKVMTSFTVGFYIEFNKTSFTPDQFPIWPWNKYKSFLLDIITETPNYIQIRLMKNFTDPEKYVDVNVIIGENTFIKTVLIENFTKRSLVTFSVDLAGTNPKTPASKLGVLPVVAAGQPIKTGSVSMTYNNANNVHIPLDIVTDPPKQLGSLILGTTEITINRLGLMDGNLSAFILYNGILTKEEIQALSTHFEEKYSGYTNAQLKLKDAEVAAKKAKSVATSINTQLQDMKANYETCTQKVTDLQAAKITDKVKELQEKWKIKLDDYPSVSDNKDLAQCSPLSVLSLNGTKIADTAANKLLKTLPKSTGPVPYPAQDVADATSVKVSSDTKSSSAAEANGVDTDIWGALMKVVQGKTVT